MIGYIHKEDADDIKRVINSDKFAQFLLSNTTSFIAAAWILETLQSKLVEVYSTLEATDDKSE